MEHFKEPEPEPEPDHNSPMLNPNKTPEEPTVLPNPNIPMISLFIPYQPYPENVPTYELRAREWPTTPWQEFLSQGSVKTYYCL